MKKFIWIACLVTGGMLTACTATEEAEGNKENAAPGTSSRVSEKKDTDEPGRAVTVSSGSENSHAPEENFSGVEYAYLKELDGKMYSEIETELVPVLAKVKEMAGDKYDDLLIPLEASDATAVVVDDLWFTMFGEIMNAGHPYQTMLVVDLTINKVFAGLWESDLGELHVYEEDPKAVPPPFQQFKDDSN